MPKVDSSFQHRQLLPLLMQDGWRDTKSQQFGTTTNVCLPGTEFGGLFVLEDGLAQCQELAVR